MAGYLMWEHDQQVEVNSVEELDLLLDLLDQRALEVRGGISFGVQLEVNDETTMLIVLGGKVSHAEFYSDHGRPLAVGSRGPWDDDELIAFNVWGQRSEMPKRFCVPIEDAREALRQYFRTGRRPDNIAWNLG